MHISETITYPASPAEVLDMLAERDFWARVADRSHPLRSEVDAERTPDGGVVARMQRTQSTAGLDLPSVVRLDEITFVQEQRWGPVEADGHARGTITVTVQGVPVTFTGTLDLAPTADGSVETLDGDLVAKIPLFGAKVEKAASPAISAAVAAESGTGREWLAARGTGA